MTTLDTGAGRLSPDDRYELASRAQNQQRLNNPRHLIMLGVVLVLISLILLVVAWQTQAKAHQESGRRARALVKIEQLIGEIQTLRATQSTSTELDIYQPIPGILSKLQGYGREAQLANDVGLPRNSTTRPEGNAKLITYPFTLRDPSLQHLLDWVRIAQREIPGLQVRELSIQPANQNWTMTVVLARYERNQ